MIDETEQLRNPKNIHHPDPRTKNLILVEKSNEFPRSLTIEDQYACISNFKLSSAVPECITTHFETAKNLYLYAWHVYRFYQVAEQHAFATLEYALRLRLPEYVDRFKNEKRGREPTLSLLLKHAKEAEILKNHLFPSRKLWATKMAKDRFISELRLQKFTEGIYEFEYDDSLVSPTNEDMNYDWISGFIKSMPKIRNSLAHGTSMLHPMVIHTFDVVSSIINQLYPETAN